MRVAGGTPEDGNLHATFLVDRSDDVAVGRAVNASAELFQLAADLGGAISGEHGVGWVKRGNLGRQWTPAAVSLHNRIKQAFDPKNLLNPGKKT